MDLSGDTGNDVEAVLAGKPAVFFGAPHEVEVSPMREEVQR